MWTSFRAYFDQNPNFLQFVSTVVIGAIAYIAWFFWLRERPPSK
jgi:hypothetical protein